MGHTDTLVQVRRESRASVTNRTFQLAASRSASPSVICDIIGSAMRNVILAALLTLPSFAAQPAKSPVVPDKVPDQFAPAAFNGQHIEGILGDRMRVNLEGRLLHVDEKALIDCFEHRPGPQDWAGEHAGKFLHAAANTWLYTDDQRLKTLMDRMARELIA